MRMYFFMKLFVIQLNKRYEMAILTEMRYNKIILKFPNSTFYNKTKFNRNL